MNIFFTFWVPCCDIRYDVSIKTMFDLVLPPVVCREGRGGSFLIIFLSVYLCNRVMSTIFPVGCLYVLSSVCRRARVLAMLFVFVCKQWCPTHILLCCFTFVCLHLVSYILNVVSFSGLSIHDCPFGFSLTFS